MRFKLTIAYPNGHKGAEYMDIIQLRHYLDTLSQMAGVMVKGEVVSIERIT